MAWEDEIGASWSGVGIGGGLVVMGTLASPSAYVYDASTGVRLKTLSLPSSTTAGSAKSSRAAGRIRRSRNPPKSP